jgi:hypothetical protein
MVEPAAAEVGGRRGECMATVALDLPSASEPGIPPRFENEADSGEGRLGEDEKTPALGDRPNPAPAPPADGGPKGSRIGEEGCRPGLPLWNGEWPMP